jgi:hypothetical protein
MAQRDGLTGWFSEYVERHPEAVKSEYLRR